MPILLAKRPSSGLLLVAGVALAIATSWHAAVMATRTERPPLALLLSPSEPVALARVQASRVAKAISEKSSARAMVAPLRRSLRELALNSEALRLLSIAKSPIVGEQPDFRLVALADKVSRRDLGTQVLLIREGGETGDIGKVLHAYDTALRTKKQSRELLFPKLALAVELPQAAPYFRNILKKNPPWLPDFLAFAISQTKRPEIYYQTVFASGSIRNVPRRDELQSAILNRLVATGQLVLARQAYLSSADAAPKTLVSPALNSQSTGRSENVLHWQLADSAGVGAQILGGQVLSAFADTGRKGVAASKVLYLAPGSYALSAEPVDEGAATNGSVDWLLTCLGRPEGPVLLGKLDPSPSAAKGSQNLAWKLSVPTGCPAVLISLEVYGGERAGGAEFNFQNLSLARAR